jgi:hypothetical protein
MLLAHMFHLPRRYGRSLMLVLRHIIVRRETAALDTLPRSGGRLQTILGAGGTGGILAAGSLAGMAPQPPDPAQVAAGIARYRA